MQLFPIMHYVAVIFLFQMMFTASSSVVSDKSDIQSVEHMSCSSLANETAVNDVDAADITNAPCAVCLDKGSGFHYGVFTCEGCKVGLINSDGVICERVV